MIGPVWLYIDDFIEFRSETDALLDTGPVVRVADVDENVEEIGPSAVGEDVRVEDELDIDGRDDIRELLKACVELKVDARDFVVEDDESTYCRRT